MADDASNLISAGSFLFSGIALLVSINANRKANAIKQRQIAIEEQREKDRQKQKHSAQLRSDLHKVQDSKGGVNYRLCIVNHGAVEARNLRVTMDGKPLSGHAVSIPNDRLPDQIGANSEVSCFLNLGPGRTPPFKVEVVWDDDSGLDNKSNNTLTFPSK